MLGSTVLKVGASARRKRNLPDWARAVALVSDLEVDVYRGFRDSGCVHAIGNGVDLETFQPRPETEGRGLVFVGALDYPANVDGIRWFCGEIWPTVRRTLLDATLTVVGRRPVSAVRRLAGLPGVELVGQVSDVRPYLASAAVAVVPLRIARGIQNQVLEAMAMGKPVVATPQALEGLQVEPGVHAVAASTADEWADALARLLNDSSFGGLPRWWLADKVGKTPRLGRRPEPF